MVPNLVKYNNKHRDTLLGLTHNEDVAALLWDTTLHDRVAFVLDNMPLSETNFRYADPKAEEEMVALVQRFRAEVYDLDVAQLAPTEHEQEEKQEQEQEQQHATLAG